MSESQQSPEVENEAATGEAGVTQSENPQPQVLVDTTDSYLDAERKIDIVAVHGLHGPSKKSWASESQSSWLKALAISRSCEARVIQFGWSKEDLANSLYSRKAIGREAIRLLEKLVELREGQSQPLPLAFFAHDIGGIIVKEALFLASQYGNKYVNIKYSTRFLMFFGCPHRSNSVPHMEVNITRFLTTGGHWTNVLQDAKILAKTVIAVNNSFLQTRMTTRATIVNGVSAAENIQQKVFDASTTVFNIASEWLVETTRPHADLDHDPDDADQYQLGEVVLGRTISFPWRDDRISPFIEIIDTQASPVYPLQTLPNVEHKFNWLGEDKTFLDWRNNKHTHFLHIHGSSNSSEAVEYAFRILTNGRLKEDFDKILYFKFDRHDIRRSSIGAMANTFLSQILGCCRETPATMIEDFEPPDFSDCWTEKDAFIFLMKTRICMGYSGQVNWILDGLDQCDKSSQWFLDEILSIAACSEQYFKVIITSNDDKHIRTALSGFPAINLQGHEMQTFAGDLAFMNEVFHDRPQLYCSESEIRELVKSCGDDSQLCHLHLEWLRDSRFATKQAVGKEIQALSSPSARKISERILEAVPENKRSWARKVLMWILYSVRPLTPDELGIALAMDGILEKFDPTSTPYPDIMQEISWCFGPLFVMENGEIQFYHPSTRDIFGENAQLGDTCPWYLPDSSESCHKIIVDTCLRYLSLPDSQAHIVAACKASSNTGSILEGQPNLLSYAIQFWIQHYRLGYKTAPASETSENISDFLRNTKALQYWAAANWYFSNPHLRSDRSFSSSLPIFAALGLDEWVVDLINKQQSSNEADLGMALAEAARHGHQAIIQTILKTTSLIRTQYLEAILAAARAVDFDILRDLLTHVNKEFREVQFPQMLLSRAAYFGIDDILEILIEAGTDVNPLAYSGHSSPLYCAILRNNVSSVEMLLRHKANATAPNIHWQDCPPIVVAAKYGRGTIIEKLVEAGASANGKDSKLRPAIWWATLLGQYEAVKALVNAGVDKNDIEISLTEEDDWPIFFTVARTDFIKSCEILLRYGVDPNKPTTKSYPRSPLGWAAIRGHVDTCRLLIEHKADVNGSDYDKPVIHAVSSGKREVLDLFLEKGANLDVIVDNDALSTTPLIAAAELNFVELAKVILENGATIDFALPSGKTALYHAVSKGNIEIIKLYIEAGGDTSTVAYDRKWGMLHMSNGQAESIEVLLAGGADIDAPCGDGTPLYLAAYNGHLEEVKLLMSHNANLEIRCDEQGNWDDGCTPLQAAAALGHHEIVRALLEGGADPKAKNPKSITTLMLAVANNKEECVIALLEYLSDLEVVDAQNNTVLTYIDAATSLSIAKRLVNRGVNVEHRGQYQYTFLCRLALIENIPIIKYILEKKPNINIVGSFRGGPMHAAAYVGNIEILKLFIENGGDINLADPNNCGTPLQTALLLCPDSGPAVRYLIEEAGADVNAHGGYFGSALNVSFLEGTLDEISLILEKGADINYPDNFGRRPIYYASFKTTAHIRLLLNAGVEFETKTKLGQLPLHIAVARGSIDVVDLILSETQSSINEPDDDGWTPLMWACRICDIWGMASNIEAPVIELLLSRGADLWARGRSSDREWSPLKLARYHGASEEVIKLLTPKIQIKTTEDGKDMVWDPKFHSSRPANRTTGYCDSCLFGIYGTVHACLGCVNPFYLCFKCWGRKDDLHPHHDQWELRGTEYKSVEEEVEAKAEDKAEHETGLVEQVEDDDTQGDWSNDEDEKDEKKDEKEDD